MKPSILFDGILIIKIFACRKVWRLLDSRSISTMNGSTLIDDNSGTRLSEVVEALTWLPIKTKCTANGSPSQPLPNMLIVLIGNPLNV
jgi:hypothetical protein